MASPIYRTDYPDDCRIQPVEWLTLVYHRPSAATHFLDSPLPDLLAILSETPCDRTTLAARLCERLGLPLDEEAQAVIDRRIEDLLGSGLIRAA